jgi:gas vesicle protein
VGQDPGAIRQDIEQTRERMGETVEALGYKTNVPGRAKEAVTSRVDSLKSKVSGATPDSEDVKQGARSAAGVAQENPLGLALGSVAVGFIAGMLIPATRVEDEKLGQVADDVKERVKETGQEALERGKQVAQDAAQSAQETVKESGQQHAQDLRDSAQENAQDAAQSAQSRTPAV